MQIQQWLTDTVLPQQLTHSASLTARSSYVSTLGVQLTPDVLKSSRSALKPSNHHVTTATQLAVFSTPIQLTVFNTANESRCC